MTSKGRPNSLLLIREGAFSDFEYFWLSHKDELPPLARRPSYSVLDNRKAREFGIRLPHEHNYLCAPLLKGAYGTHLSAVNRWHRSRI
jgi:hypothetical protein